MPFPSTIAPDVAVWHDATQQAYSDSAGTVPAGSGRIRRLADPSPLTGAWTSPSDPERPIRDSGSVRYEMEDTAGGYQLTHPSVSGIVGNACTLAISYVSRNDAFGAGGSALFQNDARDIGVQVVGGTLWIYHANTLWFSTRIIAAGQRNTIIVRYTATTVDVLVDAGGTITTEALTGITVPATTLATAFHVGCIAATYLYGSVTHALVAKRTISDTERDDLRAWLVAQPHPDAYPTDRSLIAWVGDSIPASVAATPSNSYPVKTLAAAHAAGYLVENYNVSVPGTGVVELIDATQTDPNKTLFRRAQAAYSALRAHNILILALGTNDLANGNSVSFTLHGTGFPNGSGGYPGSGIYPAVDAAVAQGWGGVLVIVPGPRSNPMSVSQATYNANRAAVCDDLVANCPAHGAIAIDTRSILHFGADGDSDNTTYYSLDKIHPLDAAHALLWPVVFAAVRPLLAAAPPPPPAGLPVFQMQGLDASTQALTTWVVSGAPDWAGTHAPVSVTDVILYSRTKRPS